MITASIPNQQVTTVRHSSMNWRRLIMDPMAKSSIGTLQLEAALRPAFSMMSAGNTPATNRTRNSISVANTEEIRALVSLATTSPTAKRTITTANHSNISNTCHSSFLYLFVERAARRSLLEILVEPVAQSVEPDQTG